MPAATMPRNPPCVTCSCCWPCELPQCGLDRACADMDDWGYSFRLGSTRAWFEQDASDARLWLLAEGIVSADNTPTGALRL